MNYFGSLIIFIILTFNFFKCVNIEKVILVLWENKSWIQTRGKGNIDFSQYIGTSLAVIDQFFVDNRKQYI